jgi:hypothetical protein
MPLIVINTLSFVFLLKHFTMGSTKRKSWVEKRNSSRPAEVEVLQKSFADIEAGEKMLVATPQIVDAYIRNIPKGKETNMAQMRKDLAAEYHADKTCPLTSGIFLRIVAEAAHEELEQRKPISKITPYWRIMDEKSNAAKKLSVGMDFLKEQRKKEKLGSHKDTKATKKKL